MTIHRLLAGAGATLLFVPAAWQTTLAQVPGSPVLQNAFVSPGLAFAANLGGSGRQGEGGGGYLGLAAAWGLSGGRLQLSAGAGTQRARGANRGAYGVRAAANVWNSRSGSFGAGAFVGFGGAPSTSSAGEVTNPSVMSVPAGISIGYKRLMGETRGLSVYASPFYAYTRTDSGAVASSSGFRLSAGIDYAFSQSFGVSVGGDFGARGGAGGGTGLGAAITYVPGRR